MISLHLGNESPISIVDNVVWDVLDYRHTADLHEPFLVKRERILEAVTVPVVE